MRLVVKELFRVQVPATCAHLGPGYAVLGVALNLTLDVRVHESQQEGYTVEVGGSGPAARLDPRHDPLLRGFHAALELTKTKPPPGLRFVTVNDIPPAAGLGSATALYAAGLAAGAKLARRPVTVDEVLDQLARLGGDPAHGAAALQGGLAAACMVSAPDEHARYRACGYPLHSTWRFVVALPDAHVGAADAQRILPATLPHAVASRTSGRLLGLLRALAEGNEELAARCLRDEVHVPFRRKLVPGMEGALQAALTAGACGSTIAGHGPGIVALTTQGKVCPAIAAAMQQAFSAAGIQATTRTLESTARGALSP